MINKSIKDRRTRLADMDLMNSQINQEQKPDDWMADFAKKQPTPEIAQSPEIPSQYYWNVPSSRRWKSQPQNLLIQDWLMPLVQYWTTMIRQLQNQT